MLELHGSPNFTLDLVGAYQPSIACASLNNVRLQLGGQRPFPHGCGLLQCLNYRSMHPHILQNALQDWLSEG
jgi:hypothetical protein